jgi:hypothetical protein
MQLICCSPDGFQVWFTTTAFKNKNKNKNLVPSSDIQWWFSKQIKGINNRQKTARSLVKPFGSWRGLKQPEPPVVLFWVFPL